MKTKKSIIVTITDEALKDIEAVSERLKKSGMTVSRVLPITGVITGSCDAKVFSKLEGVSGVSAVEEETVAQIPDSEIK